MYLKITPDEKPYFILLVSVASIQLKRTMITFIVAHNENPFQSCDVIHSDLPVSPRDMRIPSVFCQWERESPPLSLITAPTPVVAYVQTGSNTALVFFYYILQPPQPSSHCELVSPHITSFSPSVFSCIKTTHKHVHIHTGTHTLLERSSHIINGNCMQTVPLAAEQSGFPIQI